MSQNSSKLEEGFGVAVDLSAEYIIKIALVEFPFLNIPVINQLFTFMVKRILSKIKAEGQLLIGFKLIDNEVEVQKDEYNHALEELNKVLSGPHTEEQKHEAIKQTKDKLRNLVRFPK